MSEQDDCTTTRIECELGEMHLEVEAESDRASEIFEEIWRNRIEEKQEAETIEKFVEEDPYDGYTVGE